MTKISSRTHLILLLGILLLAFTLRMARIGELRMWGDEAYSVFSAHRTLTAITLEGAENDPHPPLYYYLLHFYMPVAGTSELALRFFSVFPALATIALLYVIGKRLFDLRVGLVAAAFGAIAPFDVYYSQEIRMYALAIFLTALALYFFVRLLQADDAADSRQLWFAYALTMLLALYSLYHTAFVLLAQGIFLLTLFRKRRAFVLRWFAVACAIVVLFLPWLAFRFSSTLGHLEDRAGHVAQSLPVFAARGFGALMVGGTLPPAQTVELSEIFGLLIVVALIVAFTRRRKASSDTRFLKLPKEAENGYLGIRNDWLLIALAAVPILVVYPLYLLLPILVARLFALAFVPLALLIAHGLVLLDRRMAIPFAIAILAISAYSLDDYVFRFDRYDAAAEDYMPLIHAVEQQAHAGDMVLIHADWQTGYFLSHYQGPPVQYGMLANRGDLQRAVGQPRTIWAVVQGFPHLDPEDWLARHAFPLQEAKFGEMRLITYRAGLPSRGDTFAEPLVYDNGIALLGYRINGEPVESGRGRATVLLQWQATQKIADDYTMSLRLTGEEGQTIWAQDDAPPASGTLPTSEWEPGQTVADYRAFAIPAGTPPGQYALELVMYQSDTKRPASVVAPENQRGQIVELGSLTLTRPSPPVPVTSVLDSARGRWNEVALVGIESGAREVMAGGKLALTLYWQAQTKPARAYSAVLRLVDASGTVRATSTRPPGNSTFPTTEWNAGETWVDKTALTVDAAAAEGDAALSLGLVDAASGEPVGNSIVLAHIKIDTREHSFALPTPQHPLAANFDNKIKLLGYDYGTCRDVAQQSPKRSGVGCNASTLNVTLYWQALASLDKRYTVFVHLLDASGNLVAQRDSEPQEGAAPTTSWLKGEVIQDRYAIALPAGLPTGDYTPEAGLYDAVQGTRLPLSDQKGDHLLLARVRIASP